MSRVSVRLLAIVSVALFMALQSVDSAAQTAIRPGGPIRVVLLVDSSQAISDMIVQFRAGLRGFLEELPGEPEIALITTGSSLRVRVGPTSDRGLLTEAIDTFSSDGGASAFLSTLLEADERFLQQAPERRSIFVILATDLNIKLENAGIPAYNEFLPGFLSRGGRAHAIIIRSARNPTGITTLVSEHLTTTTGGFYETVVSPNAVPKLMRTVAAYVAADQW